jgi:glycosyltransferase involved in cell wall biosynthesis
LLVSGPDVAEICIAIKTILEDRALAKELAEAGRRRVEERFSVERMVDGMIRVYEDVLSARREG